VKSAVHFLASPDADVNEIICLSKLYVLTFMTRKLPYLEVLTTEFMRNRTNHLIYLKKTDMINSVSISQSCANDLPILLAQSLSRP